MAKKKHNDEQYKDDDGKFVQRTSDEKRLRITGMWERYFFNKKGESVMMLKSGKINKAGWQNLQQFGDDARIIIMPVGRGTKGGGPEFCMWAMKPDYTKKRASYSKTDPHDQWEPED